MWIERDFSKVLSLAALQTPSVLVVGSRQTGKTSLLKHQFPKHTLLNLDDLFLANQAQEDGFRFLVQHPAPLFVDEVQYAPNLFRALKLEIDKNRNNVGQYMLSGSQRFQLMSGVSESLAGRISVLELFGLSSLEIEKYTGKQIEGNFLFEGILSGGYPEIYARNLNLNLFFSSYLATYVERDVRQILNVKNTRDFDRFLRLCAARSGQLLSASALANELGMSATTVRNWLDVCVTSQIIELVEPWHSKTTQRIIKTPKLYFLDTGLLCALLNISGVEELKRSPFLGFIFETHVFSQIKKYFANQGLRQPMHFFRTHEGQEIDFVLPRGGNFHLIECKLNENPSADKKNFKAFEGMFGESCVLSRKVVGSRRGSYLKENGWFEVNDSVHFDL